MTSEHSSSQRSACTLSPDSFRDRKALIDAILERCLVQVTPVQGGVRARFAAGPEIEAKLNALVRLEAECCTMLSMTLDSSDGEVVLEVTGPSEAQSLIQGLFSDGSDSDG